MRFKTHIIGALVVCSLFFTTACDGVSSCSHSDADKENFVRQFVEMRFSVPGNKDVLEERWSDEGVLSKLMTEEQFSAFSRRTRTAIEKAGDKAPDREARVTSLLETLEKKYSVDFVTTDKGDNKTQNWNGSVSFKLPKDAKPTKHNPCGYQVYKYTFNR